MNDITYEKGSRDKLKPHRSVKKFEPDYVFLSSGMLLFCDFVCLLLAAYITTHIYAVWFAAATQSTLSGLNYLVLITAVLAPALLYDKRFGTLARRRHNAALVRCFLTGFAKFAGAVFVIGLASRALDTLPRGSVAIWLAVSFVLTAATRLLLAANVQRLERKGVLAESIAIVGAGPVAERLIHHLRQTRPESTELLGVYDDAGGTTPGLTTHFAGSIDDLIELGKVRSIDWILVTVPGAEEEKLLAIVHKLKALSAPIALCPQNIGLQTPYHMIGYVGGNMPVRLLADRPAKRWSSALTSLKPFLPRWITSLAMIPSVAVALFTPLPPRPPADLERLDKEIT